jgi:membrane protease YdiL (CAAX protease family)
MKITQSLSIKILIAITAAVLIFHFLIVLKIIPYDIAWGGRLQSDQEMYTFESFSIIISLFFIYVLAQKGNFVSAVFSDKALSVILWIFFGLFVLNTIGNIFAKTTFEKWFALVTLINAFLLWRINRAARG